MEMKKFSEIEGGGSGITCLSSSKICKYWANGKCKHGKQCHNLHSWSDGILIKHQNNNPKGMRLVWWTAPPDNFVKINCDGAFTTFHGNRGAAGGVVRDCHGTFVTGFSCPLENCDTVMGAELRAIKIGMEIALSMGFENLVVESDSYAAVELINQRVQQNHLHADLISLILCLSNNANRICWNHVFRETNSVADGFAKHGLSLPSLLGVKLFIFPPKFSVLPLWIDKTGTTYYR